MGNGLKKLAPLMPKHERGNRKHNGGMIMATVTTSNNGIDLDIDICFDGIRAYFVSGAQVVSDLHLYKQYRAAIARIAELERTQPVSSSRTFDGAAYADTFHDVMTSGRMP